MVHLSRWNRNIVSIVCLLAITVADSCTSTPPQSAEDSTGPCRVKSLTLINADTDLPISGYDPVKDGAEFNIAKLPTRNLNLLANIAPRDCARHVDFSCAGSNITSSDATAPFTRFGDSTSFFTGGVDYFGYPMKPDKCALEITPYGREGAGATLTLHYEVVDQR